MWRFAVSVISGFKLEKSSGLKFQSPGAQYLYFWEVGGTGDQSGGVDGGT